MAERHEMILNGCVESGAEEWFCPSCGRRMLMRWPPEYDIFLLAHGDDAAVHVGAKGGLQANDVVIAPAPARDVPGSERQWLLNNGIDWNSTAD